MWFPKIKKTQKLKSGLNSRQNLSLYISVDVETLSKLSEGNLEISTINSYLSNATQAEKGSYAPPQVHWQQRWCTSSIFHFAVDQNHFFWPLQPFSFQALLLASCGSFTIRFHISFAKAFGHTQNLPFKNHPHPEENPFACLDNSYL